MTKVAYLIASHTNPAQIQRLVQVLHGGRIDCEIVIHHDYDHSFLDPAAFADWPNIHILQAQSLMKWGGFSMIEMTIRSIEWICEHLQFDWLVFLSGQDYPLQPVADIERALAESTYDGFVDGVRLDDAIPCGPAECFIANTPGVRCIACLERYQYHYYRMISTQHGSRAWRRLRTAWPAAIGPANPLRALVCLKKVHSANSVDFFLGLHARQKPIEPFHGFYKGSQWFTINRVVAEYIRDFIAQHPQYVEYYRRTLVPDESFFQTIIFGAQRFRIMNDSQRFVAWHDTHQDSPGVLHMADFATLVASGKQFARKFDITRDSAILDLLDQQLEKAAVVSH